MVPAPLQEHPVPARLASAAWRVLALPCTGWPGQSAPSSGAGSSPGAGEAAPASLLRRKASLSLFRAGCTERAIGQGAREQQWDGRERRLLPHLLCSTTDKALPWPSREGLIPAEFSFL